MDSMLPCGLSNDDDDDDDDDGSENVIKRR